MFLQRLLSTLNNKIYFMFCSRSFFLAKVTQKRAQQHWTVSCEVKQVELRNEQ